MSDPALDVALLGRLAPWRCRAVGCAWERRKAYDYCRYCRAARWHIAAPTEAPGGDRPRPLTMVARGRSAAGTCVEAVRGLLVLDCEGSELFVDPAEPACP